MRTVQLKRLAKLVATNTGDSENGFKMYQVVLFVFFSHMLIIRATPSRTNLREINWSNWIIKRSIDANDIQNSNQHNQVAQEKITIRKRPEYDSISSINWKLLNTDSNKLAKEMRERRRRSSSISTLFTKQKMANRYKRQLIDTVEPIHYADRHLKEETTPIDTKLNFDQLSERDLKRLAYLIEEMQALNDQNHPDDTVYSHEEHLMTNKFPPAYADLIEQPGILPFDQSFYRDEVLQHPRIALNLLNQPNQPVYYDGFLHPNYSEKRRRLTKRSTEGTSRVDPHPEFYKNIVLVSPVEIAKSLEAPAPDWSTYDGIDDTMLFVDPTIDLKSPLTDADINEARRRQIRRFANARRQFLSAMKNARKNIYDAVGRRRNVDDQDDIDVVKNRRRSAADNWRWRLFAGNAADVNDGVLAPLGAASTFYDIEGGDVAAVGVPSERRLTEYELEKRIASLARYLNARKRRFK